MGGYAQQLEQRGEQRGPYNKALDVAHTLLESNVDVKIIMNATKLPESKILELKNSNPS